MKKLYSLALAAILSGFAANAQITLTVNGEPSDKTFADFSAAMTDAMTAGNYTEEVDLVYTVNEDVTVTTRVLFEQTPAHRNVTFRGAEGKSVVVTRANGDNLIMANKKNNYTITFENLIIDGGNRNNAMLEAENGCVINFKDVKFQNTANKKNANGIFQYKGTSGDCTLLNVTYGDGIEVSANSGMVNTNGRKVIVDGKTDLSFRLYGNVKITAGENLQSTGRKIELYLENMGDGNTVVANSKNVDLFTAIPVGTTPADNALKVVGNDIKWAAAPTIYIGETGYYSLEEARDAASDGDVIELRADQTITSRFGVGKDITIKGAEGKEIALNYGITSGSKIMLLFNDNTKETNITLENITIDGKGNNAGTQFIEVSNKAKVTMKDVVVRNCTNTGGPVIKIMGNSSATLNNVTSDNVTSAADNGFVFVGNSRVTMIGDFNGSICVENNYSLICNEFAPEAAIDILFSNTGRTNNSDLLRGFTDLEKVNLLAPNWILKVAGENIKADYVPAQAENFYVVRKHTLPTYDHLLAEDTKETLDSIVKETGYYKFILFNLAEGMQVYVAEPAEAEAAAAPMADGDDALTVGDVTYKPLAPTVVKDEEDNDLTINLLPVSESTSFVVKSGAAVCQPVEVTVKAAPGASGIDEIDLDADAAEAVYYNLQGVRVDNPVNGLYIKRQGGKAVKVVVK